MEHAVQPLLVELGRRFDMLFGRGAAASGSAGPTPFSSTRFSSGAPK
jgi:hypothetical protein